MSDKYRMQMAEAIVRIEGERNAALGRETALRKEVQEIKESMAYRRRLLGRVQAERDAALAAEQLAIGAVAHNQLVIKELQQDLNHRDEQIATLDLQREAHLRNSQVVERRVDELQQHLTAADERADVLEGALRELLAGTGNSPGANRKYGKARAVLAGSQKQAAPEPYQGIPGTSFQRLNALANQGE